MTERVLSMINELKRHDLLPPCVPAEHDPMDMALPTPVFNGKRAAEYLLAQPVYLTESNRFTGQLRLGKITVPGDIFTRSAHRHFGEACSAFYNHYIENLVVFEWQHSAPDYRYILDHGVEGCLSRIEASRKVHAKEKEKLDFLCGLEYVCRGVIAYAEKCAAACEEAAAVCRDPVRRAELSRMAEAAHRVPRAPARTFYEGLFSILFCFQCLPDSIGTIDRHLLSLYEKDLADGTLTREEAKDLVQEFFVHICNYTPEGVGNPNADRSAECHFAIGGYREDGEDGFSDLSRLLAEALLEMDTRRPAISLRWTEKTKYEDFRFMMECERRDKNKRFAFVSDTPRIRALMRNCGLSYPQAVKYTMVGCNEPSFPGAVWFGGCTANAVRSLTRTLYECREEAVACRTFDEFFALYLREFRKDVDEILRYANAFNAMRAKDCNVLSCFLLDGCIENAVSATQGGTATKIGGFSLMGITSVVDSLTVVSQFVFDEGRVTMAELIGAMERNWEGNEDLRQAILHRGRFFGNHDPLSDGIAQRFTTALHGHLSGKTLENGARILVGTLAGYNPHHIRYGERTRATPDGRRDGDPFMVGCGQSFGKDREGITSLLASVAGMDPEGILAGPFVCNLRVESDIVKNDERFEKFCRVMETYFRMGGMHYQLNYVSKEELLAARENPGEYRSLKVRISGFSATFVTLSDCMQQDVIDRTEKS